jgi:hypothetical protein
MVPLCSVCADTMNEDRCTHSDVERCIFGKWIVDVDRKAVELGYELKDVFEVWGVQRNML